MIGKLLAASVALVLSATAVLAQTAPSPAAARPPKTLHVLTEAQLDVARLVPPPPKDGGGGGDEGGALPGTDLLSDSRIVSASQRDRFLAWLARQPLGEGGGRGGLVHLGGQALVGGVDVHEELQAVVLAERG